MTMEFKPTTCVLGVLILLAVSRSVLSAYCNEDYECRQTCTFTFALFQLIFGGDWTFEYPCRKTCTRSVCCAGYEGDDCSQLTDDCTANGNCLGQMETQEYTDGCVCKKEETMTQKFMGSNKRFVNVPCETPCERTVCRTGFTGTDCNIKVEKDGAFLTETQLESIREQLKIDEGNIDHVYIDSEGYPTFGIGHLIQKTDPEYGLPEKTPVSEDRINQAFRDDVHIAVEGVQKIFPNAAAFPGEVKEIIVNMVFNLGEPRLKKFKNFIAAVNAGDWDTAADEMVDSLWYRQVKGRAERLVDRMRAVTTGIGEE